MDCEDQEHRDQEEMQLEGKPHGFICRDEETISMSVSRSWDGMGDQQAISVTRQSLGWFYCMCMFAAPAKLIRLKVTLNVLYMCCYRHDTPHREGLGLGVSRSIKLWLVPVPLTGNERGRT